MNWMVVALAAGAAALLAGTSPAAPNFQALQLPFPLESSAAAPTPPPMISLEGWRIQGKDAACSGPVGIVAAYAGTGRFGAIPVTSARRGRVTMELTACASPSSETTISSDDLRIALVPLGVNQPVGSVTLPSLATVPSRFGAAAIGFTVREIPPGYYRIRLSGTARLEGPGLSQTVTPRLGTASSDIVLFVNRFRRTLPAAHSLPPVAFRGLSVAMDWVDSEASVNKAPDAVPQMTVELRARLPLRCHAGRDWYATVTSARFRAEGKGINTEVPQWKSGATEDAYAWALMPLPAETTGLEGAISLDVRSCHGSHPLIAKSILRTPIPAPTAYRAPATASPAPIGGMWRPDSGTKTIFSRPLDLGIRATSVSYQLGSPVSISVHLWNFAPEPLTLVRPLVLHVQILDVSEHNGVSVIWGGILPSLHQTLAVQPGHLRIDFDWDQHDAAGHQVPPGAYYAVIKHPAVAHFSVGGQPGQQALDASTGWFIIHQSK